LKGAGKSVSRTLGGVLLGNYGTKHGHTSSGDREDPGDEIKQRGLARTIGANHAHPFSRANFHRDVLDGAEAAETLVDVS